MSKQADADNVGVQMREIAEIELAIQGGTEKIETLGECVRLMKRWWGTDDRQSRRAGKGRGVHAGNGSYRSVEEREGRQGGERGL